MKVQIVIKQGKETEVYEVEKDLTISEFVNSFETNIDNNDCVKLPLKEGFLIIGDNVLKNSIIEFKEIKD